MRGVEDFCWGFLRSFLCWGKHNRCAFGRTGSEAVLHATIVAGAVVVPLVAEAQIFLRRDAGWASVVDVRSFLLQVLIRSIDFLLIPHLFSRSTST